MRISDINGFKLYDAPVLEFRKASTIPSTTGTTMGTPTVTSSTTATTITTPSDTNSFNTVQLKNSQIINSGQTTTIANNGSGGYINNSNNYNSMNTLNNTMQKEQQQPQLQLNDSREQLGQILIRLDRCIPLSGDFKVEFYFKHVIRKEKLFHFWFNTYFVNEEARGNFTALIFFRQICIINLC